MRVETTAQTPARPRRILVAAALDAASGTALQRGAVLAQALGAEVHVIHILPASMRPGDEASEEVQVARRATLGFCESMLARPFAPARVLTRRGDVAAAIEEAAAALDAAIVVIGGDTAPGSDHVVANIVRRASRPVLVARPAGRSDAIVAATDFSDWSFPALAQAVELGGRLRAPLTFVHNVDPLTAFVARSALGAAVSLLGASLHDAEQRRAAHLRSVAAALGRGIRTIVTRRETATAGILAVARERDADLVVVGAHRGAHAGVLGRGTAEILATTAPQSVLAVPVALTRLAA